MEMKILTKNDIYHYKNPDCYAVMVRSGIDLVKVACVRVARPWKRTGTGLMANSERSKLASSRHAGFGRRSVARGFLGQAMEAYISPR